jgi:cation:H+ antiporter
MDAVLLTLGLVLLVGAGDALVRGAVALSLRLGVPAAIIGATIIGFGTSAPELLISVEAAITGSPGIALGNVVGSNVANVFLVLGIPAMIATMGGSETHANRNLYLMLGATAVFAVLLMPGVLWRWGGALLAGICLAMILDSIRSGMAARDRADPHAIEEIAELEEVDPHMAGWKLGLLIAIGLVGLPLGADFLIAGARGIAAELGISEAVIGVTVVAFGTSLPELAATVAAAIRREADVAIGNVIGSNVFNITGVIGIAALASPVVVPAEIVGRDLWWMIAASLVLAAFVLTGRPIPRLAGAAFLAVYAAYLYAAFAS